MREKHIDELQKCEYNKLALAEMRVERRNVMVDVNKLRNAIRNSTHTIASLSSVIGIDESTFYRKLSKDGSTFTIAQADTIKRELNLDAAEAQDIFFGQ